MGSIFRCLIEATSRSYTEQSRISSSCCTFQNRCPLATKGHPRSSLRSPLDICLIQLCSISFNSFQVSRFRVHVTRLTDRQALLLQLMPRWTNSAKSSPYDESVPNVLSRIRPFCLLFDTCQSFLLLINCVWSRV